MAPGLQMVITWHNLLNGSTHWVKFLVSMILILWIQILFATTELNMVQGGKKNLIITYTLKNKKEDNYEKTNMGWGNHKHPYI